MSFATANNLAMASGNLHIATAADALSSAKAAFLSNNIWRAPIAACALGGLMVLLFNLLSLVILVRKSITRGGPGFGYGFLVAWAFVMTFFTLLCGLIMQGFTGTVETKLAAGALGVCFSFGRARACEGRRAAPCALHGEPACAQKNLFALDPTTTNNNTQNTDTNWTIVMTGAFKATYGFAYLACICFLLFFLTLLLFQGAVTKELGICE